MKKNKITWKSLHGSVYMYFNKENQNIYIEWDDFLECYVVKGATYLYLIKFSREIDVVKRECEKYFLIERRKQFTNTI